MQDSENYSRPARTWTDFVSRRWRGIEKPNSRIAKVELEKFLDENNFRYLEVIKKFSSASEVKLNGLPEYFVLKPTSLWSSKGVMLLHRISGLSLWYNAMAKKVLSETEVRSALESLEASVGRELNFMIEKRALHEDSSSIIPLDYKVFTFYGVPKFVLQVDRNFVPPQMAYFDGNFDPILDDRVQFSFDKSVGTHQKPECWQEVLELAKNITVLLKASFISVDCYATPSGPILGELTHTPGGPWYGGLYKFSEEFDLELGDAWQEANDKLGVERPSINVPYDIKMNGKVFRTIV